MFFKKRGQAALEFLMTYAWAILVVIIIIGALAYFGVLNPDTLVPDKCTFATGLACQDFSYTYDSTAGTGTINLVLVNGLGKTIEITQLNFTSEQIQGANDPTQCGATFTTPITVENGNSQAVSVSGTGCMPRDTGRKIRVKGLLTYQFTNVGALPHRIEGELFTKPIPQ